MTKNKKGFTIIEVVLVLAIAGLIFLMVFIALPALQRSQRNTQRKDDIARFITAINDYQGNNSGKSPFRENKVADNFVDKYIKGNGGDAQFTDPNGDLYEFTPIKTATKKQSGVEGNAIKDPAEVTNKIAVYTHAGCGELENTYVYSSGSADVALFYVMEGGQVLCNDNH